MVDWTTMVTEKIIDKIAKIETPKKTLPKPNPIIFNYLVFEKMINSFFFISLTKYNIVMKLLIVWVKQKRYKTETGFFTQTF